MLINQLPKWQLLLLDNQVIQLLFEDVVRSLFDLLAAINVMNDLKDFFFRHKVFEFEGLYELGDILVADHALFFALSVDAGVFEDPIISEQSLTPQLEHMHLHNVILVYSDISLIIDRFHFYQIKLL